MPRWLQRAAGWSWRLLLVGIAVYLAFRVASMLKLVVLPCVAALLLTALLQPVQSRLRRAGLPALAATWCTLLFAVAVLGGAVTLAATRATADYPTLVRELTHTGNELQTWLAGPPFHIRHGGIEGLSNRGLTYLKQHQSLVAGTVLSGGKIFLEILAGLVLMLFITFFLLKDGDRIWAWLTGFLGTGEQAADPAGRHGRLAGAAVLRARHHRGGRHPRRGHRVLAVDPGRAAAGAADHPGLRGRVHPAGRHPGGRARWPSWSRWAPRAGSPR